MMIVSNVSAVTTDLTVKFTGVKNVIVLDYEVTIIKEGLESKFLMYSNEYPTYGMIVLRYNELR